MNLYCFLPCWHYGSRDGNVCLSTSQSTLAQTEISQQLLNGFAVKFSIDANKTAKQFSSSKKVKLKLKLNQAQLLPTIQHKVIYEGDVFPNQIYAGAYNVNCVFLLYTSRLSCCYLFSSAFIIHFTVFVYSLIISAWCSQPIKSSLCYSF